MKDDSIILTGLECIGGNGNFDGEISIKSEKYDSLPPEIKNTISYRASNHLRTIRHEIEVQWAKINNADERSKHVTELAGLFILAGFDKIYVEVIDNQYSVDADYYRTPWIIVTTGFGRIILGWRKRVLNLDWSDSTIKADGNKLFSDEKTTTDKRYVHCHGKEKAVEYLKRLKDEG